MRLILALQLCLIFLTTPLAVIHLLEPIYQPQHKVGQCLAYIVVGDSLYDSEGKFVHGPRCNVTDLVMKVVKIDATMYETLVITKTNDRDYSYSEHRNADYVDSHYAETDPGACE